MEATVKLYCMVDRKLIPWQRVIQRSATCSDACQEKLRKARMKIIEGRKCLTCYKPSTPEDRALFRRFKAWLIETGQVVPPKKGRRPKKAAEAIQNTP